MTQTLLSFQLMTAILGHGKETKAELAGALKAYTIVKNCPVPSTHPLRCEARDRAIWMLAMPEYPQMIAQRPTSHQPELDTLWHQPLTVLKQGLSIHRD